MAGEEDQKDQDENSSLEWSKGLEGKAVDIAANPTNRLCIQAGPGTGKTTTVMHKVLRLIWRDNVPSDRILAVTFTRTAAQDLRKNLDGLAKEAAQGVRASTLHSIAKEIVTTQGFLDAYDLHFRPLLTASKSSNLGFEAAPLLADLNAHGTATELTRHVRDFEAYWSRKQGDPIGPAPSPELQDFENDLFRWLRFHKCILIGQLIPLAVQYLQSEPDSSHLTKFDHVLADEYQDLNRAEQCLVDLLCDKSASTVVGDADQSIYAFKCAEAIGLLEYAKRDGVHSEFLDECYRCPPIVVELASATVSRNRTRASQPMRAISNRAGAVFYRRYANLDAEAKGVAAFIAQAVAKGGVEIGKTLVLCPSREIGRRVKTELLDTHGMEAISYFYEQALEEWQAQRAFAIMQLLCNRHDRVALRYLLGYNSNNPPKSSWRTGEYSKLREFCDGNNANPWDVMVEIHAGNKLLTGVSGLTSEFATVFSEHQKLAKKNPQEVLDALFPADEPWATEMRLVAGEYVAEDIPIASLFEQMLTEITQPVVPDDVNHVRIMSLHRSKGLTVDAVAIAGCINGLMPRKHDPKRTILDADDHREEQRRLFYVALTRTTNAVLISSPKSIPRKLAHDMGLGHLLVGSKPLTTTVSTFVTDIQTKLEPVSASNDFFE